MSVCAICWQRGIRDYSTHDCPGVSSAAQALLAAFDEMQLAEMHAAASARIKQVSELHRQEWNACDWCSTNDRHVPWPCPTIRALDDPAPVEQQPLAPRHGDSPGCTATFQHPDYGLIHCAQPSGHYDPADVNDVHEGPRSDGRWQWWTDRVDGAIPHQIGGESSDA
jgi:hypothetical protein